MAGAIADVQGADQLVATLGVLKRDLTDLSSPDAVRAVAAAASAAAPRRTGRLAASIRAEITPTGDQVTVGAPYGGVIHAGWPGHNIKATPFLVIGADRAAGSVAGGYERAVQVAADRVRGA